jgi:hypothetical protein
MSYVIDRPIMTFVTEERARCRALVSSITDQALLLFCIDHAYHVTDLEIAKKRFEELKPVDPFEDLM